MNGRDDKIRTCDLTHPKGALYQAEPRPDRRLKYHLAVAQRAANKLRSRVPVTPSSVHRYDVSFASSVISAAFSRREIGQFSFAPLAISWNFASSSPGTFASVFR